MAVSFAFLREEGFGEEDVEKGCKVASLSSFFFFLALLSLSSSLLLSFLFLHHFFFSLDCVEGDPDPPGELANRDSSI